MRKRPKGQPNAEVYTLRAACLAELERLSEQDRLDLFYGDESGVSLEPCVPYAWQFADERVAMPAAKGGSVNCFALLSRDNPSTSCLAQITPEAITGCFVAEQLDQLSLCLSRPTVVVLDNAPIHHGRAVRQRRDAWQERGLFVFYLPPYSPHLTPIKP